MLNNPIHLSCALILPTLNAGSGFNKFLASLCQQISQPSKLILLDSESTDNTVQLAIEAGFEVHNVHRNDFNHGATRQLFFSLCPDSDIIIYMTQDSILASSQSINNILAPFADEKVGAVCGRQLPHSDASPISAHARLFNYPSISSVKSKDNIPKIGIKAAFLSNSFAAYRRTALIDVGGFPTDIIFGEDTYVAAKMLRAGWKVAYAADAACYHSHNYSMLEEFERYFDIGVFQSREKWFIDSVGKPESEGKKFVLSELRYLAQNSPNLILSAIVRSALKLLGYKLGQREEKLPLWLKRKLSMNKVYWKNS